jgi:hypothetical protein
VLDSISGLILKNWPYSLYSISDLLYFYSGIVLSESPRYEDSLAKEASFS